MPRRLPLLIALLALTPACARLRPAPESGQVMAGADARREADGRAFARFFDGEMMLRMGDIAGAEAAFLEAAQFDPASSEIQLRLCQIYQHRGQLELAEETASRAVELDVRSVEARLKYAQLLTARRAFPDALIQLGAALEVEPKNTAVLLQKGAVEMSIGRLEAARKTYERITAAEPMNAVALYSLAQIYAAQGNIPAAEAFYLQTTEAAPRFKRAYVDLFLLYDQYGQKQKAIALLRKLVEEVDPDNEELRRLYSSALINEGKLDEAVRVLEKEREIQPGNLDVLARLGYAQFEQHNFEAAIEQFRLVLARDPDNHAVRYYLGLSLDAMGAGEAAIAELSNIPAGASVYPDSLLYRAYVLEKLGRNSEAVDSIQEAIAVRPEEPRYPEYLSSLLLRAGRRAEGIDTARKALEQFPQSVRLLVVLAYLLEKEDFDESIRVMQRVLDIEPKNAEALNFIGYSWADRGMHLDRAEAMIRQALELMPEDGNITDSLGWVLYKRGKFAEALEVLKKAADMSPGVAEIRDHVGDAYLATGSREKALSSWRQALDLNPDPDMRERIQQKIREHSAVSPEPPKKPSPGKKK